MGKKQTPSNKNLEAQYEEIFKHLQTSFVLKPDNSSLAQPTPFKVLPTVVTYGAYEIPITAELGKHS